MYSFSITKATFTTQLSSRARRIQETVVTPHGAVFWNLCMEEIYGHRAMRALQWDPQGMWNCNHTSRVCILLNKFQKALTAVGIQEKVQKVATAKFLIGLQ